MNYIKESGFFKVKFTTIGIHIGYRLQHDFSSLYFAYFVAYHHITSTAVAIYVLGGNDAKLIRCVLGTTLNSSVVVQGRTVKLRPCLRFPACG